MKLGGGGVEADDEGQKDINLCLQENRWKGNSAKELSGGCKLWYGGASLGENIVRIVLTKEIKEYLVEVSRKRVRGI